MIDVDHDDAILRTYILFVQTAHLVLKHADAYFYRKVRLSAIKFIVLQALATNDSTMNPSELARWTLRERHNITTLVDRLQQDGLVSTERNSRDKRFINITLTDKGREVLKEAKPAAREIVSKVMSLISESDIPIFEESLRVLRQNAYDGLEHVAKRPQPNPG